MNPPYFERTTLVRQAQAMFFQKNNIFMLVVDFNVINILGIISANVK